MTKEQYQQKLIDLTLKYVDEVNHINNDFINPTPNYKNGGIIQPITIILKDGSELYPSEIDICYNPDKRIDGVNYKLTSWGTSVHLGHDEVENIIYQR